MNYVCKIILPFHFLSAARCYLLMCPCKFSQKQRVKKFVRLCYCDSGIGSTFNFQIIGLNKLVKSHSWHLLLVHHYKINNLD